MYNLNGKVALVTGGELDGQRILGRKTLNESRGEMRRAIENVEVACGIPILMQGDVLEDIARGIDEMMLRQPVGVAAAIVPFNFPGMIPFWFFPYALACGNTYIIKPSEKVPLTMQKVFQLIEQIDLPPGVLNMVHGTKESVDALLEHPTVRAISFVGSTPVAKYIYSRASANGKRVQAQGGAKNPAIVLPDADIEMTTQITADAAFGWSHPPGSSLVRPSRWTAVYTCNQTIVVR
jgi:malonate-semialdehyde dehydrogenase (acetylating)/methylmalonate-semialdehyde dehydrogenase